MAGSGEERAGLRCPGRHGCRGLILRGSWVLTGTRLRLLRRSVCHRPGGSARAWGAAQSQSRTEPGLRARGRGSREAAGARSQAGRRDGGARAWAGLAPSRLSAGAPGRLRSRRPRATSLLRPPLCPRSPFPQGHQTSPPGARLWYRGSGMPTYLVSWRQGLLGSTFGRSCLRTTGGLGGQSRAQTPASVPACAQFSAQAASRLGLCRAGAPR